MAEELEATNNLLEKKNEILLDALQEIDGYAEKQKNLAELLSKGIFQLSMARQYDRSCKRVIDGLRQDIVALRVVNIDEDGEYNIRKTDAEINPIYFLSGMPSKNAWNAQALFIEALDQVAKLSEHSNKISCGLSDITKDV
mmetsp:Transcript_11581/g.11597  ORF Transcript_11581/g.11597 Transcript_11581/m.11597 type:complete len:141 (-) Transcript_11581:136-558(-)|eukprot:CAMPEP_0182429404 /NCGR_PEP_ID=MMETSP1167-20130531/28101_1 /TAXON_ID=2988 /ORGANISM="Mallomonas Sp, Strain CCMP3275" /LENGTH=140 /DNA_ID=CAMNT_0024613039 /DNA_START=33 /DNA_END=455 /DNA_ORIENTATION=+